MKLTGTTGARANVTVKTMIQSRLKFAMSSTQYADIRSLNGDVVYTNVDYAQNSVSVIRGRYNRRVSVRPDYKTITMCAENRIINI